jgi:hypothetical protein
MELLSYNQKFTRNNNIAFTTFPDSYYVNYSELWKDGTSSEYMYFRNASFLYFA